MAIAVSAFLKMTCCWIPLQACLCPQPFTVICCQHASRSVAAAQTCMHLHAPCIGRCNAFMHLSLHAKMSLRCGMLQSRRSDLWTGLCKGRCRPHPQAMHSSGVEINPIFWNLRLSRTLTYSIMLTVPPSLHQLLSGQNVDKTELESSQPAIWYGK